MLILSKKKRKKQKQKLFLKREINIPSFAQEGLSLVVQWVKDPVLSCSSLGHCCGSGLIPGPRELPHATGAGKEKGTGRTWGLQSRTRKQNMEVLHTRDEELQTESRWVPEEKTQYIWPCFD